MRNTTLLTDLFMNWDLDALKKYQDYLLHKENKTVPEMNALPVVSLLITLKSK
tara:strand:+ start:2058 stop:2216 length:159 start_codon:yes stop_codon:yes gene_type:complete